MINPLPPARQRIAKVFEAAEAKMLKQFDEVREKYSDPSVKGRGVEKIVRDVLTEYLPRHFDVGFGEAMDLQDHPSGELDIVVTNSIHPFTFSSSEPGLFFIEGISAAAEVRAILTSEGLRECFVKAERFKQLFHIASNRDTLYVRRAADTMNFYERPPYFLFVFESQLSLQTVLDRSVERAEQLIEDNRPIFDAVFLMNRGAILNLGDGSSGLSIALPDGTQVTGWVDLEKQGVLYSLFLWLSVIMPNPIGGASVLEPYLVSHKTSELV